MRIAAIILCAALTACVAATPSGTTTTLTAANAATSLLAGQRLNMTVSTQPAREGMDPVVTLTLTQADGSSLRFQQANHTPHDVMSQASGGPLAQVMGFFGDEAPTLYRRIEGGSGAPFLCAPDGPVALGVHEGDSGEISMVALKQTFTYETLSDGTESALPMSPDQVCARLSFQQG